MLSLAWFSVWIHNAEFEQNLLSKNPVFRALLLYRVHSLMGRKNKPLFSSVLYRQVVIRKYGFLCAFTLLLLLNSYIELLMVREEISSFCFSAVGLEKSGVARNKTVLELGIA